MPTVWPATRSDDDEAMKMRPRNIFGTAKPFASTACQIPMNPKRREDPQVTISSSVVGVGIFLVWHMVVGWVVVTFPPLS